MCTVSYIPKGSGYILTSNRDESPLRVTYSPEEKELKNGTKIIAPIDSEKGGTWIATDGANKTACIMNGGFIKHKRQLPYRKSRGHIIYEAFSSETFGTFADNTDLCNIEPFTLVLVDENKLSVLIWDGKEKHIQSLDSSKKHLWSSSTLYTREDHAKKMNYFQEFLRLNESDPENLLKLHGLYNDNLFVLDQPHVKTVSTTQVVVSNGESDLCYREKVYDHEKKELLY
ncbi:NRDE family protein [Zhouia spongiae]|uniref:NRDE family protein n=1 Tax=Zhouia spongiae TaxID=2202721 RepID=A0ABY3YI79_9FLAO|nr:NRDE family protein [Zhouia spongiae]UNY97576.1 NRDE family protein [Zhouia spongiae]